MLLKWYRNNKLWLDDSNAQAQLPDGLNYSFSGVAIVSSGTWLHRVTIESTRLSDGTEYACHSYLRSMEARDQATLVVLGLLKASPADITITSG